MQSQEFLAAVRDRALPLLPKSMQGPQARIRYGMLQLHYGEPRAHYEVWLVRKTGRIEIGLHFEAEREQSHAWAEQLTGRALELRDALGPAAELEEWSPSWTRLHLTLPLASLDDRLLQQVAERLASLMKLTGEQVTGIPPRGPNEVGSHREGRREHWRRRRRPQPGRA